MKTLNLILFIAAISITANGQSINSGSTGADGPFNPPTQVPAGTVVVGNCTAGSPCTVTVPLREPEPGAPIHANGRHVFNFTSINIGPNVTVKFLRNSANTPVFILVQGDVRIDGLIDIRGEFSRIGTAPNGKGGPGGFDGGNAPLAAAPTTISGAGLGPGGGTPNANNDAFRGSGSFSTGALQYGTPELLPLIGGSGGAGISGTKGSAVPGGGGGGALLIAASGTINLGSALRVVIDAAGGAGEIFHNPPNPNLIAYGGSGGSVRLVATAFTGVGRLFALGVNGGGAGRIRLDSTNLISYSSSNSFPAYTKNDNPVFGQPIYIFPPLTPTIRIVSVGGVALPSQPTANVNTPDLAIPAGTANPVAIVVEASNVPSGTSFEVHASPQFGSGDRVIATGVLNGSPGQTKTATVNVTLPPTGVGVISAVIRTPIVPEPGGSQIH